MMPYEDKLFHNMDTVGLESVILDQDDSPTPEEVDQFVSVEVMLIRGYGYQKVTVTHRNRSSEGELIGRCNANPILETRAYKVVFPFGEGIEVSENRVDGSILTSCDAENNSFIMIKKYFKSLF